MLIAMNVFGERLKEVRELQKMTRRELAKEAGIDPSLISRYEHGDRSPTAENIVRIAQALKVSADYLLGLTDNPQPYSDLPEMVKKELEECEQLEEKLKKIKEILG